MKQFSKLLLVTLGFGLLAAVLSSVPSKPVAPFILASLMLSHPAFADGEVSQANRNHPITISVGADQTLTYPSNLSILPDEHTTIIPPAPGSDTQNMAQISYNDALRLYLMTFVCISLRPDQQGVLQPYQAAWYFSTATSLDLQNWTAPQMIENSQFPTVPCGVGGMATVLPSFDGWHPSFMSPGSPAGHTALRGLVFFGNGCDEARTLTSRTFTIPTK